MAEIQRPSALYKQVAAALRHAITSGEFPPGTPLPSETQLIERYQVSRPTVRNAIAALRAEGLIEVIHGKGSYVRTQPTATATLTRAITRNPDGTYTTDLSALALAETPHIYRTHTDTHTAPFLELDEGEALFGVDRLYATPAGARIAHRTLIPFATAEGTELADHPDTDPDRIYSLLAEAGHSLTWTETTSARMPRPDERTTLRLPDATPLLHTTRITHGNTGPLILEDLHTSGDTTRATYRITADTAAQS
ncbi:GntR family transcriptional regulator [Streptomyces sp. YIM 98790]|uniref:GntR family transcriptional regulator n=1 Tax=Streptomyces sp. YIM 98790 TaxID=2689077 RepID=UPI00140C8E63|nr:GntR family transcriptional regulator [Streptomyces sp. YIM 98790]